MDRTYVPVARSFVYLRSVVDWFSRKVLSWRLSITMEAAFYIEAVEEALAPHGKPDIFNADQGSQFTSIDSPRAEEGEDRHLHGWQGRLAGQQVYRTALAYDEIRGSLSPRLQNSLRARAGTNDGGGIIEREER